MHARQDWTEPFTHIACRQPGTGQELNILLHRASNDASANWLLGLEFLRMPEKPSPESGTSSGKKDPLVLLARYSEIGFIIPAAILLGFFLGKLALSGGAVVWRGGWILADDPHGRGRFRR